jgi:Virulence factor membrane-bound polymerase, C-terminal/O-Antigen ligase/Protein glycosylation ligase
MSFSRNVLLAACIALPWLSPFAAGPSSAMVPWLITMGCVACALTVFTGVQWYLLPSRWKWFFGFCGLYFCIVCVWQSSLDVESTAALIAWGCVFLVSCLGFSLAKNTSWVITLAKIWVVVALASCLLALLQYLSLDHWFTPWISQSGDGVAYANLRQRNQFSSLCGIGLLCLLLIHSKLPKLLVIQQLSFKETFFNRIANYWPWLATGILAIGNGLSSSRTGAVQWVLILATVLLWRNTLRIEVRRLAYGGLGIYALAVTAMPWFAQLVGNSNTGLWGRAQEVAVVGGGRMVLYSNVIDLIAMKPWFGWGWRELAYAHYSTHFDVRFVELVDNAHNLPLHLAVELGVPFAVLFCGAVLWWVVRNAPWRETDPARQLAWGILMLIGVHSMVEYPLWYGPFLMTLGLCLGLLQRPKKEQNSAVVQASITPIAIKFIPIALLCITAYLAFDYHRVSQIYLSEEDRSALYRDDVMGAAKRSVVFKKHAQFAELVTTPVTPQTAPHVLELALKLIHFSPEPRVIEPLIESATMLHFDDIAMFHLARYKAMYPKDYAAWTAQK